MDVYLSKITTQTNGSVFRTYTFTYNSTSDGTKDKYYRLTQVDLANGAGRKVAPIKINWEYLPSLYIYNTNLNVQTSSPYSMIEEDAKTFIAVDVNNDGISDIIRLSPGAYVQRYNVGDDRQRKTFLFVSLSKKDANGNVTYQTPKQFDLDPSFSTDDLNNVIGGIQAMDFDGDGYNDLIIPYYCGDKSNYDERYTIVWGKSLVNGGGFSEITSGMVNCDHTPLFTTYDSNGDGRDDLFYLEDRAKDGYYNGAILRYKDRNSFDVTKFQFKLDLDPKKLFVGDYNHDGLTDIIVFYDGGYKIYYNNGGELSSTKYTEYNSKKGTNLGDKHRIVQGDFDGDGITDFAFFQDDWKYGLAINNGDGTFTVNNEAITLSVTDQNTYQDNDRFNMVAYDFDHDGKCDFVITKAHYVFHGGFRRKYYYDFTKTLFVRSTGTGFELHEEYVTHQEKDAEPNNIFLGDFTGDGDVQYASFGKNLLVDNDKSDDKIHTYRSGYNLVSKGKISSITDGFGLRTFIRYKSATEPSVYTQTDSHSSAYPVNSYTIPVPLVSEVIKGNDGAGSQFIQYQYGDLKLHVAGKGIVGFSSMTTVNLTLGTKETTTVDKWDTDKWIPLQTTTTSTVGGNSSKIISYTTIANNISGQNYYAYTSRKSLTDLDGNKVTTVSNYDVSKGVLTDETVKNDGDNMYKKVSYSGYQNKAGVWLPTMLTMTQKHRDDAAPYTSVTTYGYDDKGNVLSSTVNSGTNMALKTTSTYDVYGNVLSSVITGSGVKTITKYNDYDPSGRFVIKSYTNPASAVNTFTYDLWGNVLTENDATEPSNILTTKYTYDGWGRKQTALLADGTQTTYNTGWGTTSSKKYYSKESTTGKPSVTVWYDKGGHEVLQESFGAKGVPVSKATTYSNGQISRVENKTGKLTITQDLTYDKRGRVVTDVLSSGKSASYSYGNRSVTTTIAGRSYTKATDAWGNVVKSTDPVSEVEYLYSSIGKPSSVKTQGSTVTMSYDAAGNQLSLTDPDAGTSTYTYAADGTLLTQTDGRGIKTINNYDDLGRLASTQIGQKTIVYTYGTTGNEKLRLVKLASDNNSVEYTHDKFGRVVTEKRNVDRYGAYSFSYAYNSNNQLSKTTYPGGLEESYLYDNFGFKSQSAIGDKVIYKVESTDGLVNSTSFMGKLTTTLTRDARGYESNRRIARGSSILENFDESYDGTTDNLLSRKRNNGPQETFGYDNLDRLVSVKSGTVETMKINYASNGNILFKTGIGNFSYDKNIRPHAVTEIENADGKIPGDALNTSFNDFGKIQLIEDAGKILRMDFAYGPDQERWYSELSHNGTDVRTTVYAGEYEKITENGNTREFYYLDGNTIAIKENGSIKTYLVFTDNLGSILSVMDENGAKVFDASYDAWGKQTVTLNTIGLHRGYTGHEMLSEFDIINMNGRLYDPVLGRFFSPDNYVQMPDNSQNFNRYSYCLNNPLKYTDPSGELAWFVPVIAGAIIGAYAGASIQSGTAAFWNWKPNAWKGAIVGGIIGATIGYGVSSALASSGGITGLTTIVNNTEVVTKSAGITSSILNSGSINIAYNAITGGSWDSAWKAGIAGLATGTWAITGGFGMVKGFGSVSRLGKLAGKLGYQMIGTVSQSVGFNWAAGKGLFSKVTLGVGPLNLTLGKGQRLLQWENNLGNIAFNSFGLINTAFGGRISFDAENLTLKYTGGLMDVFQPNLKYSAGFSPHTVTGNSSLSVVLPHELHHLWQSRALNDLFLANYGLQGLYALILKGNFVANKNYYEDFVDSYSWWPTH